MDDVRGEFVQDFELALSVIRQTGQWMIDSGHNPSDFWKPANLTVEFVLTHAKRDEFYAYVVDGEPAAAYVAQEYDDGNSWREVDVIRRT